MRLDEGIHVRYAVGYLSPWAQLGIGLGTVLVAFAIVVLTVWLWSSIAKTWLAATTGVLGLALALAAVVGGAFLMTGLANGFVQGNAQALQVNAARVYGIHLTQQQALNLDNVSKFSSRDAVSTAQDSGQQIGETAIIRNGGLTKLSLYRVDGTFRLYTSDNSIRELPRVAAAR